MTQYDLIKKMKAKGVENPEKALRVYGELILESIKDNEDVPLIGIGILKSRFTPKKTQQAFGRIVKVKARHRILLKVSRPVKTKLIK